MINNFSKTMLLWSLFLLSTLTYAQETIELEDIWAKGTFRTESVQNFISVQNGKFYAKLQDNEIVLYDFKSGKQNQVLVSSEQLQHSGKPLKVHQFKLSNDENKVLILANMRKIYRHSFESLVFVYHIQSQKLEPVFEGTYCRYPLFSPQGNRVSAVIENNIYIQDLHTKEARIIGGDGYVNHIINGAVDWVYEEEFSMSRGYEWSPDGEHLAYYRFDESVVPEFTLKLYQGNPYPNHETYRYPKAGKPNSKVSIWVYDFEQGISNQIMTTEEDDSYIPRIQWSPKGLLYLQKLNRHQNHLEIFEHNPSESKTQVFFEERNPAYIDINPQLYFNSQGTAFLFLTDINGFQQIAMYSIDSKKITFLTPAEYDVSSILNYDTKKNLVYFSGYREHPTELHMYSLNIKRNQIERHTQEKGWHSVSFTSDGNYYLSVYSDFNTPPIYRLYEAKGKLVRNLVSNTELKNTLSQLNLGSTHFGVVANSEGQNLHYWQIRPPDFDSSKSYPVLFYVYGGPGSQTVKNAFGGPNYLWHQMLAQKGYIVMSVDNRGTGGRGSAFQKATYLNLGKYEIEDQIAVAEFMKKQRYVDSSRIGIWGWSYGGFMSSLGISVGSHTFKTAIAVAPVTHWQYYDNIYTERYMRTPQENPEGYEHNAPLNHVKKIKGKYLLIHGMADDNVHVQHAMEMIKEMIKNNIEFESEMYPNKDHGIYGGYTRLHLYKRMTRFLLENL